MYISLRVCILNCYWKSRALFWNSKPFVSFFTGSSTAFTLCWDETANAAASRVLVKFPKMTWLRNLEQSVTVFRPLSEKQNIKFDFYRQWFEAGWGLDQIFNPLKRVKTLRIRRHAAALWIRPQTQQALVFHRETDQDPYSAVLCFGPVFCFFAFGCSEGTLYY